MYEEEPILNLNFSTRREIKVKFSSIFFFHFSLS